MCTASWTSAHDAVGQCGSLPTRCIAVESAGTAVSATIRSPSAWLRLQAAARADADQLLAAELDQLLEDDRRARAAHAGALHRDRLALVGAGVAEQPALARSAARRRRGRSRRCTWRAAGRREAGRPRRTRRARRGCGSAWRGTLRRCGARIREDGSAVRADRADARPGARVLRARAGRARLPRGRRAPRASAASSRVEGDDGALAALCHVGANLVPSGDGCGAFAEAAARQRARR